MLEWYINRMYFLRYIHRSFWKLRVSTLWVPVSSRKTDESTFLRLFGLRWKLRYMLWNSYQRVPYLSSWFRLGYYLPSSRLVFLPSFRLSTEQGLCSLRCGLQNLFSIRDM